MNPIVLGGAVGLFVGSFGYILGRFWVLPIWRYRSIKRRVLDSIQAFLAVVRKADDDGFPISCDEDRGMDLKKLSSALIDCYQHELPSWYRLLLSNRGEVPTDAAMHLMGLANISNYEHAARRTQKIIDALHI